MVKRQLEIAWYWRLLIVLVCLGGMGWAGWFFLIRDPSPRRVREYLAEGRALLDQKKYEEALIVCNKIDGINLGVSEAQWLRYEAYLGRQEKAGRVGNTEKEEESIHLAMVALQQVYRIDPDDPDVILKVLTLEGDHFEFFFRNLPPTLREGHYKRMLGWGRKLASAPDATEDAKWQYTHMATLIGAKTIEYLRTVSDTNIRTKAELYTRARQSLDEARGFSDALARANPKETKYWLGSGRARLALWSLQRVMQGTGEPADQSRGDFLAAFQEAIDLFEAAGGPDVRVRGVLDVAAILREYDNNLAAEFLLDHIADRKDVDPLQLELGRVYLAQGYYTKAETLARAVRRRAEAAKPEQPLRLAESLLLLSQVYEILGQTLATDGVNQTVSAEGLLIGAVESVAGQSGRVRAQYLVLLGDLYRRRRRFRSKEESEAVPAKALERYEQAVAADPRSLEPLRRAAKSARDLGRVAKAYEYSKKILQIAPNDTRARKTCKDLAGFQDTNLTARVNRYPEWMRQRVRKAFENPTDNRAIENVLSGFRDPRLGYRPARIASESSVFLWDIIPVAGRAETALLLRLAELELERGDIKRAHVILTKHLRGNRSSARSMVLMGRWYLVSQDTDRQDRAKEQFEAAIIRARKEGAKGRKPHVDACLHLAQLFFTRKPSRALRLAREGFSIDPYRKDLFAQIEKLYAAGYPEPEEMVEWLEEKIKQFPDSPLPLNRRGLIRMSRKAKNEAERRKALQEAEKDFKKAARHDDTWLDPVLNRAEALETMGKTSRAIEVLESALRQIKNDWRGYGRLGELYRRRGNKEKGDENFMKAVQVIERELWRIGDDWRRYARLGELYRRLGNKEKADASFKKARALNPKFKIP